MFAMNHSVLQVLENENKPIECLGVENFFKYNKMKIILVPKGYIIPNLGQELNKLAEEE